MDQHDIAEAQFEAIRVSRTLWNVTDVHNGFTLCWCDNENAAKAIAQGMAIAIEIQTQVAKLRDLAGNPSKGMQ